jgi:2-polyprenyl-3-methyl-5-hydroxy-6-metoxy-1,4-benzoquinol methylase
MIQTLFAIQASNSDFEDSNWTALSAVDAIGSLVNLENPVYLVAPETDTDGPLAQFAKKKNVNLFFGNSLDVNSRFEKLVDLLSPKVVVRINLVNFMVDPEIIKLQIGLLIEENLDLVVMAREFDMRFGGDVSKFDFFSRFRKMRGSSFRPWADVARIPEGFKVARANLDKMPVYDRPKSLDIISNFQKLWPERWQTSNSPNTLYEFMISDYSKRENGSRRILDIACGHGDGTSIISGKGHFVTGIDYDSKTIDAAKSRYNKFDTSIEFKVGDGTTWKGDKLFDSCFSVCTMGHIKDDGIFISNIRENLKLGGYFYNAPALFKLNPLNQILISSHYHEYSIKELVQKTEKHFEIVEIFGVDRDFIGPMEIASDFSIIIARAK